MLDVEKNIVLSLNDFGRELLNARERKGLSQRALSKRTGLEQAHISKIEQGRVDIRLSSLVEIARALDLDLQLVPRQALPAVEGVIRATASEANDAVESRALATLDQQERNLELVQFSYPDLPSVEALLPTIRDLKVVQFDPATLKALERAVAPIKQIRDQVGQAVDTKELAKLVEQVDRSLRNLRKSAVHSGRAAESSRGTLPAYRLDDEDDDG